MTATPQKSGDRAVRTDPDPITKRYPGLGGLTSVEWMSGTLGDERVPGPSTYWIDAVVRLTVADLDALRRGAEELRVVALPDLAVPLRGRVPEGRVLTSDALSAELLSGDYPASVYLVEGTDAVLLVARFG